MNEKDKQLAKGMIKAENKAREREREAEPDVQVILDEARKADLQAKKEGKQLLKMTVEKEKPHHVYVEFIQKLKANIQFLTSIGYFTTNEQALLWGLEVCIEPHSNILLIPEYASKKNKITSQKSKQYASVADIARYVNIDRGDCSRTIKELTRKGAVYQVLSARNFEQKSETGQIRSTRILVANPELFFAGYQDEVGATLCAIVREDDIIERKGHKLPYKLWWNPQQPFGKLISRETWLAKKRAQRTGK